MRMKLATERCRCGVCTKIRRRMWACVKLRISNGTLNLHELNQHDVPCILWVGRKMAMRIVWYFHSIDLRCTPSSIDSMQNHRKQSMRVSNSLQFAMYVSMCVLRIKYYELNRTFLFSLSLRLSNCFWANKNKTHTHTQCCSTKQSHKGVESCETAKRKTLRFRTKSLTFSLSFCFATAAHICTDLYTYTRAHFPYKYNSCYTE